MPTLRVHERESEMGLVHAVLYGETEAVLLHPHRSTPRESFALVPPLSSPASYTWLCGKGSTILASLWLSRAQIPNEQRPRLSPRSRIAN